MNLFFRRIWIYLSTLFLSKRAPLTQPYARPYRVWISDQDMFMHMTNSRYLSFADLARLNLLIRTGLREQLRKRKWRLEICGQTRTITRMLKAPQRFQVVCEIDGWQDTFIAFRHRFVRGDKIHAEVNTLMRVANAEGAVIDAVDLISTVDDDLGSSDLSEIFIDLVAQSNALQG